MLLVYIIRPWAQLLKLAQQNSVYALHYSFTQKIFTTTYSVHGGVQIPEADADYLSPMPRSLNSCRKDADSQVPTS